MAASAGAASETPLCKHQTITKGAELAVNEAFAIQRERANEEQRA